MSKRVFYTCALNLNPSSTRQKRAGKKDLSVLVLNPSPHDPLLVKWEKSRLRGQHGRISLQLTAFNNQKRLESYDGALTLYTPNHSLAQTEKLSCIVYNMMLSFGSQELCDV